MCRAKGLPEPATTPRTQPCATRKTFAFNFPDVSGHALAGRSAVQRQVVPAIVTGTWCPNRTMGAALKPLYEIS
jgi:hypothetical protein